MRISHDSHRVVNPGRFAGARTKAAKMTGRAGGAGGRGGPGGSDYRGPVPIPDHVAALRAAVGHDLLWLTGVTAIVLDSRDGVDHLLLGRRADNGRWAAVYGILEPGEQPAIAAAREVAEETGVRCDILGLASVVSAREPVTYPNGDRAQYLDLCFLCTPTPGAHVDLDAETHVADDESTAVGWFPLDALPEPLAPSTRERLDLALAFRADPSAGPYFERP